MKNVFVIHSYNADTKYSFAPSIEKLCKENNIDYSFPIFPIREEATYEKWENILNEYLKKGLLNSESIVISHSLGTQFIPKYLAKNNVKIKTYISVAGFLNSESIPSIKEVIDRFKPSSDEYDKCKKLVDNIYSVYSDNDEISSLSNLESYADILNAKKIFIQGGGHFNPKSKVTEIKEINRIIMEEL